MDKAGEVLIVGQGEGWVMGSGREKVKGGGKSGEVLRVEKVGGNG